MHVALSMARTAFHAGEVPVGAAAVHAASGTIVATAHNESEQRHDPTAHAEMLCLRRAAQHPLLTQGWRDLRSVTLYVTLEPCAMCAGAVLQVRDSNRPRKRMSARGDVTERGESCVCCGCSLSPIHVEAIHHLIHPFPSTCCERTASSIYILPSSMCMLQARVGRVVYGARSTLLGAHGSWVALLPGSHSREDSTDESGAQPLVSETRGESSHLINVSARRPHPYAPDVPVCGGVLADECGDLMRTFFRERSRGRTTSSHIVDVVS